MPERAKVYPLRREPPAKSASPTPPEPSRPAPPEPLRPAPPEPLRPAPPEPLQPAPPEPLWRDVLGRRLRALRLDQDRTLAEIAGRAGISPQYLSEIERGRKEPSSEMIAALAGALGTTLTRLTEQVSSDLRRQQAARMSRASGPVMLSLAA
jgi:DNA-binding XRE family transcriptional regulator